MNRVCPVCGKYVLEGDSFCGNCGTAYPTDPQGEGPTMFCPVCGEKIPADSDLCPNCGKAVPRMTTRAVRKIRASNQRNYKIYGIAAVAAVAVLVVVLLVQVLPGMFSSPAEEFVSHQQGLVVDRLLNEVEVGLDSLGSGQFSTDLTITGEVEGAAANQINQYLEDTSILLKLDLQRDALLANAELTLMGSPVLSGALTYDKGQLGFALPEVDDSYYVMDLSQVLNYFAGTQADLTALALPEISGAEWRSLIQSYLDIVYTVVTEDNVEKETIDSVSFSQLSHAAGSFNEGALLNRLEDGFKGTVYTFTPTAGDIQAMLEKLADSLEQDETLRSLILELINPEMLRQLLGESAFEMTFGTDGLEGSLDNALLELAGSLRSEAGGIGSTVEEAGLVWTLCMEGDQVRMIRIETEEAGGAIVYGTSGSEKDGMTELFYIITAGSPQFSMVHEYTKDGSLTEGEVSFSDPYGDVYYVEYELDESKQSVLGYYYGTYEYETEVEDLLINIEVLDGEDGGVDHIISVRDQSGYYFEDMLDRINVTINATDKGSAQKPDGATVDISSYDTAEYQALFEELGQVLQQDLITNLAPLLYGMYG